MFFENDLVAGTKFQVAASHGGTNANIFDKKSLIDSFLFYNFYCFLMISGN